MKKIMEKIDNFKITTGDVEIKDDESVKKCQDEKMVINRILVVNTDINGQKIVFNFQLAEKQICTMKDIHQMILKHVDEKVNNEIKILEEKIAKGDDMIENNKKLQLALNKDNIRLTILKVARIDLNEKV